LISPAFITHPEDMKAELANCHILLWEGVIATAKSVVPILKQLKDLQDSGAGGALLIIAGGYEAEALSCIINNKISLKLPLIAVRMEAYGDRRKEVMRDIAALTGGKAFTEDLGLKIDTVKFADLGQARKVVTNMAKTQILGGKGKQDEVAGRVAHIQAAIESVSPAERSPLRQRLAALLGGITVIKVGGVTVTEMEEKKDRVVDALSAAKAAVESGIVPGGGTALLHASRVLLKLGLPGNELPGIRVVQAACLAVTKQIAENAGLNGEAIAAEVSKLPSFGYNAFTDKFEDLVASGIIDPLKVVVESLKNASAVSCSILTMGATISEIKQEKSNV
jgi:chaperonin GroEL